MRVPLFSRKQPQSLKGIADRVSVMRSGEIAMPRLPPRTLDEALASRDRSRRIRANGAQPS
jgi:hypothetical protein